MREQHLQVHGGWTLDRIAAAFVLAAVPALAAALVERGAPLAARLVVALLLTLGWQILFAWSRRSTIGWDGAATAIAFVVLLPDATPLWQTGLAISFGVVLGEQIFGGRGRAFLSPATVGLAFLHFAFHYPEPQQGGGSIALATLPGGLVLVLLGLVSWRTLGAAIAGFAGVAALQGGVDPLAQISSGTLLFALVFLGCDPCSSAVTDRGRLVYGALAGALAALFGAARPGGVAFALLLASIFAPLVDHLVVRRYAGRRKYRRG